MPIKPQDTASSWSPPSHEQRVDLVIITLGRDGRLFYDAHAVAEATRASGFRCTVLELDSLRPLAPWRNTLLSLTPRLVLTGGTTAHVRDCLHLSRWWLNKQDGAIYLFGPTFAIASDRRTLPRAEASGVIVGDVAHAAVEILRRPRDQALAGIPGIDHLDGSYLPRAPRPLESAPFPRFGHLDLTPFRAVGLPLRLSRGCRRRCAFCGEQPREGIFRARSAEAVFEELQFHVEHSGVRRFSCEDLVINGDLQLLDQLAELLLTRELRVFWWGRALIDPQMPPALYRKIRRAGCIGLELEVISGDDTQLRAMGAEHTADQAARAATRSWAAGINTGASFLIGLPGGAEGQLWQTAAWLRDNRHVLSRVVHLQPCQIDPGSLLHEQHVSREIHLPAADPRRGWHDGGANTPAHRIKWARELRVFIEEHLWLDVVGRAPEPPEDPPGTRS